MDNVSVVTLPCTNNAETLKWLTSLPIVMAYLSHFGSDSVALDISSLFGLLPPGGCVISVPAFNTKVAQDVKLMPLTNIVL